jgi:3-isopropylmalate/(R)-2-methylmalate dehydratase small subunit
MKQFGGPALLLDRSDINTDEIIPAKYLTEISKKALQPFLLEDLKLEGFSTESDQFKNAGVIVTRSNFGCGSSREHAVWVLEVNDINVVIGESFARIFRQNMFNCGMLAIELSSEDIQTIFDMNGQVTISVDLENNQIIAKADSEKRFDFTLGEFERELIIAGGWLAYADKKY